MPSLKFIRKRIGSVKNTQKITKAMKVVAAAKLRRVQENMLNLRPYARRMQQMVINVTAHAELAEEDFGQDVAYKMLQSNSEKHIRLLVITSDRGLAGSFNSSVCRRAEKFIHDHADKQIELLLIGKKAREYFRRHLVSGTDSLLRHPVSGQEFRLGQEWLAIEPSQVHGQAKEITLMLIEQFGAKLFDAMYVVYNEAKTAITYGLQVKRLLPLHSSEPQIPSADFIYEPEYKELLRTLLPLHLQIQLERILLESSTAEFRARMMAMDNASRNAKEMIDRLTLQFNRARQAAITKELMEIVGGAEALKG